MRFFTKAALLATAACAASGAQAATFVSYSIQTGGSGVSVGSFLDGGTVRQLDNLIFNFVALLTDPVTVALQPAPADRFNVFQFPRVTATASGNVLTLSDKPFEVTDGSGSFTATACSFSVGNALPQSSFATNNCGGVSFDFLGSEGSRVLYRGTVARVNATVFEADSFATGLVGFTPGVPEPSTWALMLAGFGLVGYSLRRRAKVAFA